MALYFEKDLVPQELSDPRISFSYKTPSVGYKIKQVRLWSLEQWKFLEISPESILAPPYLVNKNQTVWGRYMDTLSWGSSGFLIRAKK